MDSGKGVRCLLLNFCSVFNKLKNSKGSRVQNKAGEEFRVKWKLTQKEFLSWMHYPSLTRNNNNASCKVRLDFMTSSKAIRSMLMKKRVTAVVSFNQRQEAGKRVLLLLLKLLPLIFSSGEMNR
jgi:hypothetical protein